MVATLTIRDETTAGETLHEWSLEFLTERITVRELIRGRVYQEVQDYNLTQPEVFRSLVEPSDAERTLNGFELRKGGVTAVPQIPEPANSLEFRRFLNFECRNPS